MTTLVERLARTLLDEARRWAKTEFHGAEPEMHLGLVEASWQAFLGGSAEVRLVMDDPELGGKHVFVISIGEVRGRQ